MNLTPSELSFLKSQKIDSDEVLDVRMQSPVYWKAKAKSGGYDFVLGSPCRSAGHRLRTRAGHCIQCDTKKIAFIRRETKISWVYIAVSENKNVCKIGITKDIYGRSESLSKQFYGGFGGWEIVFAIKVENSGKLERSIRDSLPSTIIEGEYWKDEKYQIAKELVSIEIIELYKKFKENTKGIEVHDIFYSQYISDKLEYIKNNKRDKFIDSK
jgi:hypothetical protein